MTKSEADKIAQKITNNWKLFWMSQTQNSKQDYDNYFRRALAVDANMRAHLESLISAALVDASKVTECAEFEECIQKSVDAIEFDLCDRRGFKHLMSDIRANTPEIYKEILDVLKNELTKTYIAGQKSKALKLPSFMEIEDAATNNYKLNAGLADTFYKGACWVLNEIKSLNEGK